MMFYVIFFLWILNNFKILKICVWYFNKKNFILRNMYVVDFELCNLLLNRFMIIFILSNIQVKDKVFIKIKEYLNI